MSYIESHSRRLVCKIFTKFQGNISIQWYFETADNKCIWPEIYKPGAMEKYIIYKYACLTGETIWFFFQYMYLV